jgi:hypothetical protein
MLAGRRGGTTRQVSGTTQGSSWSSEPWRFWLRLSCTRQRAAAAAARAVNVHQRKKVCGWFPLRAGRFVPVKTVPQPFRRDFLLVVCSVRHDQAVIHCVCGAHMYHDWAIHRFHSPGQQVSGWGALKPAGEWPTKSKSPSVWPFLARFPSGSQRWSQHQHHCRVCRQPAVVRQRYWDRTDVLVRAVNSITVQYCTPDCQNPQRPVSTVQWRGRLPI